MKKAILSLGLGGLTVAAPALHAATMTVDASFVFSFAVTNTTQVQQLQLDPFTGPASALTGVTLDFDSRYIVQSASTDQHSLSVRLPDFTLLGFELDPTGQQTFSFTSDLFALGMTAADFTGGPVTFNLGAFSDAGTFTALWYAGTGVPFLGADPYGHVRLVYDYTDPSQIPLPAGAALLIGGLGGLAAVRTRKRKR